MKRLIAPLAAGILVAMAIPAVAHVTIQPNEAISGSFSRFVVRVPTERDDASTTKVELQLPPLAFVSFQPKDGWTRKTTTVKFDEPLEAFGQKITEGVGTVTWSGGKIGPGEFDEFGFSAAMPEGDTALTFKAIQTYSSGEVVKWTGAPDADSPAPQVHIYDLGVGEGEGQLAALAQLQDHMESSMGAPGESGDTEDDGEDNSSLAVVAIIVSAAALLVAVGAVVASRGRR